MIESLFRIDIALFVLIGVLGGAHCIGMCGPLVTMYSKQMTPQPDGGTATVDDRQAGHLTTYEVRQHFLSMLAGQRRTRFSGPPSVRSGASCSSRPIN